MKLFLVMISAISLFSFKENDWISISNNNQVEIKYQRSDCNLDNAFKQRWFLLNFHNSSGKKVRIDWDLELFDENQKCVTCNDSEGEYHYSLVLNSNETKVGECNLKCAPELRIVSKLLDVKASMSYPDFKLKNIKITTIQ